MKSIISIATLALVSATAFAITETAYYTGSSQRIYLTTGSGKQGIRCEYSTRGYRNTTFWVMFENENYCPYTYEVEAQ